VCIILFAYPLAHWNLPRVEKEGIVEGEEREQCQQDPLN
jgi:hypothetical protein